ncbi:hypothetical protein FDECE_5994 [Fusarium decemcellulare]|nr:hypothetical protein FDECE_5994 [Fusarium decemcellulare]
MNNQNGRLLRMFHANAGKGGPPHDIALALVDKGQYDIIFLQEPWVDEDNGYRRTKTHTAYDTYSPVGNWDKTTRPRVMTYLSRRGKLIVDQLRPVRTRDALWIRIGELTIANFYRDPNVDTTLDLLLQWEVPNQCVIAGDFNACHSTWQAAATRNRGAIIAEVLVIPTRKKADDEERFLEVITEGARAIDSTRPDNIPALDKRAEELIFLFQNAIDASCKVVRRYAPQAPWWTPEYTEAHLFYTAARRAFTHDEIRAARTKGSSQFCPPPFEFDNKIYETQLERAEALRRATLERRDAADDIMNPWEGAYEETIPFDLTVSYGEAEDATTSTGNTSPGADNITVDLLKAAWPVVGEPIRQLYEQCLKIGYHPKCFKHAEVVMIPKPGKRDLSSPRSWRPISLLSCLGKGLERLIARRMAYASVTCGVLHPQQIGALPKRSAVDLVVSLTHIIGQALMAGKVATVATADVQGAFDAVMRNRPTLRLRQQGWPDAVSRWAASFMTDRYARVRLQETLTEDARLNCGLPQGSPVSPILFLLYTQPIPFIGKTVEVRNTQSIKTKFVAKAKRFCYADDTAMIRIGKSLSRKQQL